MLAGIVSYPNPLKETSMNTFKARTLAVSLLVTLLATAAYAAPGQRSAPDPQARMDKLATVPGLTQAQRDDIIRIQDESRTAQRALMEKTHSEHQKLREESNQKLRKALGDKAYADYVTWRLEQREQYRGDRREHRYDRMGKRGQRGWSDTDEGTQPPADE